MKLPQTMHFGNSFVDAGIAEPRDKMGVVYDGS
jgi:hypothetical protein